jgi:hypothetical protein
LDSLRSSNKNYVGAEFQEDVIIWHIATDAFIAKSTGDDAAGDAGLVRDVRTLSNYMAFLHATRSFSEHAVPANL